jgi:catechol 2,3-dioxygenase-like lactoylglutathione lyase family enzyme
MNLNQVTVPSQDVPASVAFYQLLGLELIVDSMPRYARLLCPDGGATLSVHRVDAAVSGPGPVIYFECADLDAQVARLEAAGVTLESPLQDQTWLWREASLRDPAGNAVILFWAGENRIDPPWRVAPAK